LGKVKEVRRILYDAIREISPPELSFVFTLEMRDRDPAAIKHFSTSKN
jgi:hypothetical protein